MTRKRKSVFTFNMILRAILNHNKWLGANQIVILRKMSKKMLIRIDFETKLSLLIRSDAIVDLNQFEFNLKLSPSI
jgi:hypothetical protein